jgi:hypothetical protein
MMVIQNSFEASTPVLSCLLTEKFQELSQNMAELRNGGFWNCKYPGTPQQKLKPDLAGSGIM